VNCDAGGAGCCATAGGGDGVADGTGAAWRIGSTNAGFDAVRTGGVLTTSSPMTTLTSAAINIAK
jgi:hypothetical protein